MVAGLQGADRRLSAGDGWVGYVTEHAHIARLCRLACPLLAARFTLTAAPMLFAVTSADVPGGDFT
jgi:hypothetical protein